MKTYTLEIDGKPYEAFRAKDDADAEAYGRDQAAIAESVKGFKPIGHCRLV
jgi:hypothetical protein